MSLTVAKQLLPQLLGTRLDKVCGRRYHERPLGGQSLDGGAREVLLSTEGLSSGMEGRKCIPVKTIVMGLLCRLNTKRVLIGRPTLPSGGSGCLGGRIRQRPTVWRGLGFRRQGMETWMERARWLGTQDAVLGPFFPFQTAFPARFLERTSISRRTTCAQACML